LPRRCDPIAIRRIAIREVLRSTVAPSGSGSDSTFGDVATWRNGHSGGAWPTVRPSRFPFRVSCPPSATIERHCKLQSEPPYRTGTYDKSTKNDASFPNDRGKIGASSRVPELNPGAGDPTNWIFLRSNSGAKNSHQAGGEIRAIGRSGCHSSPSPTANLAGSNRHGGGSH
jgi:hypothetical protein